MAPKRDKPSLEQTVGRRQQPHRAAKEARGGRGTGLGRTAAPTTTTTRGAVAAATPAPSRATAARGQPSGQTPAPLAPSSKRVAKRGRRAATAVQSKARRTRARAQAEGVVLRWEPGMMTAVYEERRPHDNGSDRVAVAADGGQMEVDPAEDDNGDQMEVDREEEGQNQEDDQEEEERGGEHEETAAGVEAASPTANDAAATAAANDAATSVEASRADTAAAAASSAAQQHTAGKAPSAARRSRDSRWSPYPAGREGRSRERISERSARPAGTSEQEKEGEGTRDTTTGMGTGEGEDMEGAKLPSVSAANDNDKSSALAAQSSVPEQHQDEDDSNDDDAAIKASVESSELSESSQQQRQRRSKRKRAVSDDEDDNDNDNDNGVKDREAEGLGGSRGQPQQQQQQQNQEEDGGRHRSIKRARTRDGSRQPVVVDLAGAAVAVSSKRSVAAAAAGTSHGGAPLLRRSGSRSLSSRSRSRSSSPTVMTTTAPAPQRAVVTPPPFTSAREQNGVPDAEKLALRAQSHGPAFDAGAIKYAAMVYPSGIPVCWGRGDDAPAEFRIGGGGQADIYEVRHRDDVDGPSYALKVYRRTDKVTGAVIPTDELLANYVAERNAMKRARHDNIVTLHDSFMDDKRAPTRLCLLMEMMDGDVASLCRRSDVGHGATDIGGMADRAQVQAMFVDVLAALAHMHDQGLAHLDVHPSNILYKDVSVVDGDDDDNGNVFGDNGNDDNDNYNNTKLRRIYKLSDLGFAKDVGDPQMLGGHPFYMAPEVDLQNPRLAHAFPGWLTVTPASDVWALFCTLWAAWDPEFEMPKYLTRKWRVEGVRKGEGALRLRKWPYAKINVAATADLAIRHAFRRQIWPLKPFADMVEWEPEARPSAARLLDEMRSGARPSLGDVGRPGGVQAPKTEEEEEEVEGNDPDQRQLDDGGGRLDFLYMTPWRKNRRIRRMGLGDGESVSRDTVVQDSTGDHRGVFLDFNEDELNQ